MWHNEQLFLLAVMSWICYMLSLLIPVFIISSPLSSSFTLHNMVFHLRYSLITSILSLCMRLKFLKLWFCIHFKQGREVKWVDYLIILVIRLIIFHFLLIFILWCCTFSFTLLSSHQVGPLAVLLPWILIFHLDLSPVNSGLCIQYLLLHPFILYLLWDTEPSYN